MAYEEIVTRSTGGVGCCEKKGCSPGKKAVSRNRVCCRKLAQLGGGYMNRYGIYVWIVFLWK